MIHNMEQNTQYTVIPSPPRGLLVTLNQQYQMNSGNDHETVSTQTSAKIHKLTTKQNLDECN